MTRQPGTRIVGHPSRALDKEILSRGIQGWDPWIWSIVLSGEK